MEGDSIELFARVPAVTLPNGVTVPSFQVARYLCARGRGRRAVVSAALKPWRKINYFDALIACEAAGFKLITELQCLAIAHDIVNQDINWTGGKVGEGAMFPGPTRTECRICRPGTNESSDLKERQWHQLSNGERIYYFAGNAWTWVFDDVQGDERGLVARPFAKDSPSIATAPHPRGEKGMGWWPDSSDFRGHALVRCGHAPSDCDIGVFYLGAKTPGFWYEGVGFRCTK